MPERNPSKYVNVMAPTTFMSGAPNTGQYQQTLGGTNTYCKLSGVVGPDVNIWVGAGRLDSIYLLPSADMGLSGKAILFYDSAVAVSGGPLGTSGHKVIGGIQRPTVGGSALNSGDLNTGAYITVGMPFSSGLCHTTASGQFGFSVSFTPVVSG